jgi:hypothetical protein
MAKPIIKGITRLSKSKKALVLIIERKLYFVSLRDLRNVLEETRDRVKVYSWQ